MLTSVPTNQSTRKHFIAALVAAPIPRPATKPTPKRIKPARMILSVCIHKFSPENWTRSEKAENRSSIFLSGRSLQHGDGNHASVEVYISVSSTLKYQRCRSLCLREFIGLHPICKIEVHLRPEP